MTIRPARPDDLDAAAGTLAIAFEDYPWTRYIIPENGYTARLRQLQRLYLGYAHTHGLVAVTEDLTGVIALLPPAAPEPDAGMSAQIIQLHGDRIDRLTASAPPPSADAWRLETLGVHPDRRGRGIATALLTFALNNVAGRGGKQVVLDTSDPRNVRLYERHGFHVTSHTPGGDRPPVWTMQATVQAPQGHSVPFAASAEAALNEYLKATNTHDFDHVETVLIPGAVYFFGDASRVGLTEVRAYFESTWAAIPDERYWAEDTSWVADGADAAVAVYTYRWSGTLDGTPRTGAGRATNVFTRTAQGWRLTHEHLSGLPVTENPRAQEETA